MLKIEIVQQSKTGTTTCAICLLPMEYAPAMSALRGGDGKYVYLGEFVCLRCIHGGVAAMVARLRSLAGDSRRAAEEYERWADASIEMPEGDFAWALGKPPEGGVQ